VLHINETGVKTQRPIIFNDPLLCWDAAAYRLSKPHNTLPRVAVERAVVFNQPKSQQSSGSLKKSWPRMKHGLNTDGKVRCQAIAERGIAHAMGLALQSCPIDPCFIRVSSVAQLRFLPGKRGQAPGPSPFSAAMMQAMLAGSQSSFPSALPFAI
jgi:hypothetical protein